MSMRRPCESRLSTYEVRLLRQGQDRTTPPSRCCGPVPKYVVRHVLRDVAQSGHRRDSMITGAHETLGARSAIAAVVYGRPTRNQRRLSSRTSVCRTDYRGDFSPSVEKKGIKPHLGPWLDYFQYSARICEHVAGEMRQCEVAHTEGGEFVLCIERVLKVTDASTWQ